jgi:hypothetical protein
MIEYFFFYTRWLLHGSHHLSKHVFKIQTTMNHFGLLFSSPEFIQTDKFRPHFKLDLNSPSLKHKWVASGASTEFGDSRLT